MNKRWALPAAFAVAAVLLFAVAPLALSPFRLDQLGRYLCFAIVAVGIGLAWGRGGMLTLGQGVFFGMGAYLMAMHLKLADAGPGGTPDFMALISSDGVPWWWEPFRSEIVTLLAILLLPAALAAVLGLATFRRKVRGAYFAILSQALAAAFAILLVGNPTGTGGSTGLSGFRGFFGFALSDPANRLTLFFTAAGVLLLMLLLVRQLMVSRYGELLVACRDAEERVRFLGYDPPTSRRSRSSSRPSWRGSPGPCSCRSSASSRPTTSASCRRSACSSASRSAAAPRCSGRCSARSPWRGRGARSPSRSRRAGPTPRACCSCS
jgi:urea transport system permease protein